MAALAAEEDGGLLTVCDDLLGLIIDVVVDPLAPIDAVALSSTCTRLRTAVPTGRHSAFARCAARAAWLCYTYGWGCHVADTERLRQAVTLLAPMDNNRVQDVMTTIAALARWLSNLRRLNLCNSWVDAGMQAMCHELHHQHAQFPWLVHLNVTHSRLGPAGAGALGGALSRGAMPELRELLLDHNKSLGAEGVTSLAGSVRGHPKPTSAGMASVKMGDEGLASLIDNLGAADFKELFLEIRGRNEFTEEGGNSQSHSSATDFRNRLISMALRIAAGIVAAMA